MSGSAPSPRLGLQAERTALAWRRTAAGGVAVAGFALHASVMDAVSPVAALIVATVTAGGLTVLAARRTSELGDGRRLTRPRGTRSASVAVAAGAGALALGVVLRTM